MDMNTICGMTNSKLKSTSYKPWIEDTFHKIGQYSILI